MQKKKSEGEVLESENKKNERCGVKQDEEQKKKKKGRGVSFSVSLLCVCLFGWLSQWHVGPCSPLGLAGPLLGWPFPACIPNMTTPACTLQ